MKKEFKVGQRWLTRDGRSAKITEINIHIYSVYPIRAIIDNAEDDIRSFTSTGLNWGGEVNSLDLVELVVDAADSPIQPLTQIDYRKQMWVNAYSASIALGPNHATQVAKEAVFQFDKFFGKE